MARLLSFVRAMAEIVAAHPTLCVALKSLLRALPRDDLGLQCLDKVRNIINSHGIHYLNVAARKAGLFGSEVKLCDIKSAFALPSRLCRSRRSCTCKQRPSGRTDLARRLLEGIVDGAAEVHAQFQLACKYFVSAKSCRLDDRPSFARRVCLLFMDASAPLCTAWAQRLAGGRM